MNFMERVFGAEPQVDEVVEFSGELVSNSNGEIHTTSRIIAEALGKEHRDVTRKIEAFPKDEFSLRNFTQRDYTTDRGQTHKEYTLTRDGMTMLIMKFTGDEAYQWSKKFIDAFNLMEAKLLEAPQFKVPTTLAEALQLAADNEAEKTELQEKVDVLYAPDTVSMFTTTDLAKELGITEQRLRKKLILDNVMYKLRSANGMRNLRAGYENLGTQSMYYTPEMKVLGAAPDYTLKWNTDGREFILSNYSEWAA